MVYYSVHGIYLVAGEETIFSEMEFLKTEDSFLMCLPPVPETP